MRVPPVAACLPRARESGFQAKEGMRTEIRPKRFKCKVQSEECKVQNEGRPSRASRRAREGLQLEED